MPGTRWPADRASPGVPSRSSGLTEPRWNGVPHPLLALRTPQTPPILHPSGTLWVGTPSPGGLLALRTRTEPSDLKTSLLASQLHVLMPTGSGHPALWGSNVPSSHGYGGVSWAWMTTSLTSWVPLPVGHPRHPGRRGSQIIISAHQWCGIPR